MWKKKVDLQVACVDLVDDLEVSGEDPLNHGDWPSLQSLRQEGVVGVGKGPLADSPGRLPAQILQVHQHTHQLCYGQGWVSVIQLDGNLLYVYE